VAAVNARRPSGVVARQDAAGGAQEEGVFDNFERALRTPERVKRLVIQSEAPGMKRLPAGLGSMVNLEALELACLEDLEDLPEEIGALSKLRELVIDNGNGCSMNVRLPASVGRLENLRVLRLYGALDPREVGGEDSASRAKTRALPDALASLRNLEELDLGRNGLRSVPPQVASLRGLKKLGLDYNEIHELPAFVGELTNLRELSLRSNGGIRLPQSLSKVKGVSVFMGNNALKLADQTRLRARFPGAVFSFENEFDDSVANEEPARGRSKARRRR
jgi:hypothetical protein